MPDSSNVKTVAKPTNPNAIVATRGETLPASVLDRIEDIDAGTALQILVGEIEIEAPTDVDFSRAIMQRILESDDPFDMLAGSIALGRSIGEKFSLGDFILVPSDIPDSTRKVYMLIDAVNLTSGERVVCNTSAPNIMAQLWRAWQFSKEGKNPWPIDVVIEEAKAAKPGQNPPVRLARI